MKLLVTTQIVDRNDPVLGFFCSWVSALAARAEQVDVICLKEGKHDLPPNVRVHSLGKERGRASSFAYALRFLRFAVRIRGADAVLVHMNPEYLLLAGILWRLRRMNIALWYNHERGGAALALAARLAHAVLHTSPYAASARYGNAERMPAGVDTELFAPREALRDRHAVYFQGRIAPAKRVHLLLEAVRLLRARGEELRVALVGPEDRAYGAMLRKRFAPLVEDGTVSFLGPKPNDATPALYGAHGASVNLTAAGNYDKTVLEAMACGTPVVVSSRAFEDLVPSAWIIPENDPGALADALSRLARLPDAEYAALGREERHSVVERHGLPKLADALIEVLERPR